jgi:hypothetical protein
MITPPALGAVIIGVGIGCFAGLLILQVERRKRAETNAAIERAKKREEREPIIFSPSDSLRKQAENIWAHLGFVNDRINAVNKITEVLTLYYCWHNDEPTPAFHWIANDEDDLDQKFKFKPKEDVTADIEKKEKDDEH